MEQGRAADGRKAGGDKRRKLLKRALLMVAFIVAALLVAYFVEVYNLSRFEPTGDALYDRYGQSVVRAQCWNLFRYIDAHPATLPDAVLEEWEGEFGGDPRFWQLRYWNANRRVFQNQMSCLIPHRPMPVGEPSVNAGAFIDEAISRGVADSATLQIKAIDIDNYVPVILLRKRFEHLRGQNPSDDPHWQYPNMKERAASEWLPIYEQMVKADPELAGPHYELAALYVGLGRDEDALAELKAGNAAPSYSEPWCFPESFVRERVAAGQGAGNEVLAGAIMEFAYSTGVSPFSWSYTHGGLLPGLPEELRRDWIEKLSTCYRRLADSEPPCPRSIRNSSWLSYNLARYLLTSETVDGSGFNARQLTAMLQFGSTMDADWDFYKFHQNQRHGGSYRNWACIGGDGLGISGPGSVYSLPQGSWLTAGMYLEYFVNTHYPPAGYRTNWTLLNEEQEFLAKEIMPSLIKMDDELAQNAGPLP